MRKLPRRIKIGYSIFKLKHVRKKIDIDQNARKGKNLNMGECDFCGQTLRVLGKQGHDEFANTTLHEILHAINDVHKIKYKNNKQEEHYVERNADALVTLIKDNPEYFRWLFEKLTKEKLEN
jgi:hypothetical protein